MLDKYYGLLIAVFMLISIFSSVVIMFEELQEEYPCHTQTLPVKNYISK